MIGTKTENDGAATTSPWVDWPEIVPIAREWGWRVLAERANTARLERRDPRADGGSVMLSITFDQHGAIADAWMSAFDRRLDATLPDKLAAVKSWLCEDITAELKAANAAWAASRMAVMHERVAAVGRRGAAALAERAKGKQ